MLKKIYILALTALPTLAFAQLNQTGILLDKAKSIVTNTLTPLAFILAVFFFFWGVAKYIRNEGQAKADGRKIMIWGVVALAVMTSIWGLVRFLRTELLPGTGQDSSMPIPTISGSGVSNI